MDPKPGLRCPCDHLNRPAIGHFSKLQGKQSLPADGAERSEVPQRDAESPAENLGDGSRSQDRMQGVIRMAHRATDPEHEISSILEQGHKESLEFTGILTPIAVDEGYDGSLGCGGSDTGEAGGSVP